MHADIKEDQGEVKAEELTGVDDPFIFSAIIFGCCCIITAMQLAFMGWLTVKHHLARRKYVANAVSNSVCVLFYPMALVPFSTFRKLGKLLTHEDARDAGMLTLLDTWGAASTFARKKYIVFLSHQCACNIHLVV